MKMENFLKLLQAIGIVLIPVVIQISSCQLQKNELEQKYIETAVGILKEKPSIETQGIRYLAIKVFIKYSPIEVDENTENELRASALPTEKISINPDGKIMFNSDGSTTLKPE